MNFQEIMGVNRNGFYKILISIILHLPRDIAPNHGHFAPTLHPHRGPICPRKWAYCTGKMGVYKGEFSIIHMEILK